MNYGPIQKKIDDNAGNASGRGNLMIDSLRAFSFRSSQDFVPSSTLSSKSGHFCQTPPPKKQ